LSINELTKEVDKTDEEIAAEEYTSESREEYSETAFTAAWQKLAEQIKVSEVEGSSIVYAAMITRPPLLKENFQVELSVDNLSQAEELMDRRTDIHSYLRKSLNNGGVEVSFRVEKDQKKRKAYTDEEKFNKMLESNPTLLRLKNELSLDFI
jgi:DNA polymerase-3 subunit gamma/tau